MGSSASSSSSSSDGGSNSAAASGPGCVDPDDQSVVPIGESYSYYSRSTGSSDDCTLAHLNSVCDSTQEFAPVLPAVRYRVCTIVGSGTSATSSGSSSSSGGASSGSSSGSTTTTTSSTALFHDDFESGTIDSSSWTISTPDCSGTGKISIDTAQAHSGTHSIRVDGGAGYCDHVFLRHAPLTSIGSKIYARFFVRFAQALTSDHVSFLTMVDQGDGGKHLRMGGQSGIMMFNRESNDATLPELSPQGIATSYVPQVNQWTCVELAIDQTARTLGTQVNSMSISGLTLSQTWAGTAWQPSLQDINFGWESYGGVTNTLWFDDITLSNQPIGCQ